MSKCFVEVCSDLLILRRTSKTSWALILCRGVTRPLTRGDRESRPYNLGYRGLGQKPALVPPLRVSGRGSPSPISAHPAHLPIYLSVHLVARKGQPVLKYLILLLLSRRRST